MSNFDKQFKKATDKIDVSINKAIRGTILELFGEIVRRTPVGEPSLWKNSPPAGYTGGTLRGNWQVQINTPARDIVRIQDRSGTSTVTNAVSTIKQFSGDDNSIWFSNNLPYAESIEFGSSKQAPTGMMRTSVKAFQPIVNKMARKFKI